MSSHRAEQRSEPLSWGRSEETDNARQPQKVGGAKAYGREFAKGFVITALVLAVLAAVAVGGALAIKYTCGFEAASQAVQNAVDLAMKKIISIKDMTFTPVEVMKYFVAPAIGGLLVVALIGGGAAMGAKAIRDRKAEKKQEERDRIFEAGYQRAREEAAARRLADYRGEGLEGDSFLEMAQPIKTKVDRSDYDAIGSSKGKSHRHHRKSEKKKGE